MQRPRLRPLFTMELSLAAPRLMAELRERVGVPGSPFVGSILKRHVELTIRNEERHFWSPHLSLDVFDRGDHTALRGRYAPHPSLWTGLMFGYAVLAMGALVGLVYGASQWFLGWTPWALWALPVSALGAAAIWFAAGLGQRLAEAQMHQMHDFFEDCVRRASDPPAPGTTSRRARRRTAELGPAPPRAR